MPRRRAKLYLLVQPFAGWLADRVDPGLTVIVGLAVAAGTTLAIPAATGWPLIPLAVLAGLGVGTVWTNTDILVTKIAGDRQLGAAVGAAQSFKEVGDMLGPLAIGAITQAWGVRVGFIACGGAALAVVALLAWRRPRSTLRRPPRCNEVRGCGGYNPLTAMREKLAALVSRAWHSLPWRVVVLLAIAAVATVAFVEVAEEVIEGNADPIDRAISLAIHRIDFPALDRVMIFVTSLGSGATLSIAVAVLAAYCVYRRERRLALVLVANAIAEYAMNLLKHSFARPRPRLFDEITRPESYSFPSGHSMSAMVIYGTIATVLIVLRPRLRSIVIPTAAFLIVAIGFSRVYLGVHWASDVLAGVAAGVPFVLVSIHLARRATRLPSPNA